MGFYLEKFGNHTRKSKGSKIKAMSTSENNIVTSRDLPISFKVKYIGSEAARGLWGIKYTRKPVDVLVNAAKKFPPNKMLQLCDFTVSLGGVELNIAGDKSISTKWNYNIDTISYGVQDLVYTRVFAMIIVKDDKRNPFEVHAFVCDSRAIARKMTFALAAAFQDYSKRVKETTSKSDTSDRILAIKGKFAIDLRTPEEQEACEENETEA